MMRLASLNDLPQIMEITNDAKALFRRNNSLQWADLDGYPTISVFEKDIALNQLFLYVDGCIKGYIVISPIEDYLEDIWDSKKSYAVIHRIAVKKEYHHQQIGEKMVLYAFKKAQEYKKDFIRIDTAYDNIPMLHIINKLGFKRIGVFNLNKPLCLDPRRIGFEKKID